jgi:hypothetical protein
VAIGKKRATHKPVHFRVARDGTLAQLVKTLPDEPPVRIDLEGDEPYTSAQNAMLARLDRELERHYYPAKEGDSAPKIVRPKPIAPGARVAHLTFDDEVWQIDAVDLLLQMNAQHVESARSLKTIQTAAHQRGAEAANAKKRADRTSRDLMIWGDDGAFRVALATGDNALLERVLVRCKVPKAQWPTFKVTNIDRAIARRHGVSVPTVKATLKRMKER